jgi:hypothetical protein
MSMWEFHAATEGWLSANIPDRDGGAMSAAEKDDIWQMMKAQGYVH